MNYFLKANQNFLTFSLIFLLVIPIFGINFLMSLLGNILLLFLLIPILFLILIAIGFNFYKSKLNTCVSCGAISSNLNEKCINCGADFKNMNSRNQVEKKPGESTIEVKAEEIK